MGGGGPAKRTRGFILDVDPAVLPLSLGTADGVEVPRRYELFDSLKLPSFQTGDKRPSSGFGDSSLRSYSLGFLFRLVLLWKGRTGASPPREKESRGRKDDFDDAILTAAYQREASNQSTRKSRRWSHLDALQSTFIVGPGSTVAASLLPDLSGCACGSRADGMCWA